MARRHGGRDRADQPADAAAGRRTRRPHRSRGRSPTAVSPLALNNPMVAVALHQLRENALAARGACIIDQAPEPSSLTGLADHPGQEVPRRLPARRRCGSATPATAACSSYIRRRYHYAVLAHEMGHSVGLRHNFVEQRRVALLPARSTGSSAPGTAQVTTPCTDAVADGATCVGPRYWDPVTDEEQSKLIWMCMQSIVMDYPGDVSQDMLGLGVTDFAAARFFYGDNVSGLHRARTMPPVSQHRRRHDDGDRHLRRPLRHPVRREVDDRRNGVDEFHYSQLQNNYQVINNCCPVTPTGPPTWDDERRRRLGSRARRPRRLRGRAAQQVPSAAGRLRSLTASFASRRRRRRTARSYSGGPNVEPTHGPTAGALLLRQRQLGRHSATSRSSATTTAPTPTSRRSS